MPDRIHELLDHDDYIGRQLIRSWLAGGLLQRLAFAIHQADIMAANPTPNIQVQFDHPQPPDRKGLYFADQLSNTVARWCVIALADPEKIELVENDQNGYSQIYATIEQQRHRKQSFYIDHDRHLNPDVVGQLFDRFERAFDDRIKLPELPMKMTLHFNPHYQTVYGMMGRQAGRLLDEWDLRQPYHDDRFWAPQFQKLDLPGAFHLSN
jgi:hypothetical protein